MAIRKVVSALTVALLAVTVCGLCVVIGAFGGVFDIGAVCDAGFAVMGVFLLREFVRTFTRS